MTTAALPKSTIPAGEHAPSGQGSESRVDRDSHFNGLFETRQDLRVEGVAEGEIQCQGTLTVAEGARVKAKVTANAVTIAGELEGEVTCRGVFQIMPSGQVEATVSARSLIVQEGGFYNGEFHMINDSAAPSPVPSRFATQPAAPRQPAAPERPANNATTAEPPIGSDEWWAKMAGTPPKDDAKPKSP